MTTYTQWNCRIAFYLFVALSAAHQAPPKVAPLPPPSMMPAPAPAPKPKLPETMLADSTGKTAGWGLRAGATFVARTSRKAAGGPA
jgi:hypothetical protein